MHLYISALNTPFSYLNDIAQSWGLGVSFCYVFRHNSLMNILQDIFRDHYEEMIYTLHPRSSVIENVDKMINCGNPSYGGAMYGCPGCGLLKLKNTEELHKKYMKIHRKG